MTILHIDSSIQGETSISRQITAAIVSALADGTGEAVIHRDLSAEGPGAINPRAPDGGEASADQFLAADVIVVGAPMYNLSVPARLKAWLDSISIPRKTFRYTEHGPEGLAGGRRVVVAYASGGFHRGPQEDFVDPYLRAFFRLLGIGEIDVVRAEGVNISPEHREKALAEAAVQIATVATRIRGERLSPA